MQPHERITFIKVIADVVEELEMIKVRLEKLEQSLGHTTQSDRKKIADLIQRHFSADEIDGLAFSLDLNGDYAEAESRAGKARELVLACERRSLLPDLLELCKEKRPRASWPVG